MDNEKADIGLVGLGVMGRNLALNIADHGFSVAGLDRNDEMVMVLANDADSDTIWGTTEIDDLIPKLKKPRAVLLLVPAGDAVDAAIMALKDRLEEGDIIIDGGNSHFTDTDQHAAELDKAKIRFLGMGISGGSDGARNGPSMMLGGPEDAYKRVKPIFEAAAAHVDGDLCVTYLGPGSAGHYVKMVHNGIEYALMQLIAEAYDILKRIGGLTHDELSDVFSDWNQGELGSFLIDITSQIFRVKDDKTHQRLIDMILDAAKQKGTGKWTSQDAMDLQVPVPCIDAAVSARDLSASKQEREDAARVFTPDKIERVENRDELTDKLRRALHFAMIVSYAQGLTLLRAASAKYEYGLHLPDNARIWRGGCIIRTNLLEDIRNVYTENPDLASLMLKEPFAGILTKNRAPLRRIITLAADICIPVPGLSSALAYFDGYRTCRLPANLIQAQRDFFGSHTYERIDSGGTYHSEWS